MLELDADFVIAAADFSHQTTLPTRSLSWSSTGISTLTRSSTSIGLADKGQAAEADVGNGLVDGFVVFILHPVERDLDRHVGRVADKLSNRRVIGQWTPAFR